MELSTLRPGVLVSLKTSVTGNVAYRRRDLETGRTRAVWETERTIDDPAEFDEATKVRSKCRTLIVAACSTSSFGLLCPDAGADELEKAMQEAQRIAAEFNERARRTRIAIYIIAGRIAADDVEAVRAINSEVRELLADMESGLKKLNVKAVREAANKAKSIGRMLSPEAAARIQTAVDIAREQARKIVKAGEAAEKEIDKAVLKKIRQQRTAFLDLDGAKDVAAPSAVGRAVDLAPEPEPIAAKAPSAPAIEL